MPETLGANSDARALLSKLNSHRFEGDYDVAIPLAEAHLKALQDDPLSLPWELADGIILLDYLALAANSQPAERRALAKADSLIPVILDARRARNRERMLDLSRARIAFAAPVLGADHPELQRSHLIIADAKKRDNAYAEAESLYTGLSDNCLRLLGDSHPLTGIGFGSSANLFYSLGRYDDAESSIKQAKGVFERAYRTETEYLANAMNSLGLIGQAKGDFISAEANYRKALAIRRQVHGESHRLVASSLTNVARLLWGRGELDAAEPIFREALAMTRATLGEKHLRVANLLNHIGNLRRERGEVADTEAIYLEALGILGELFGENHLEIARTHNNLGALYWLTLEFDRSRASYHNALKIWSNLLGEEHPRYARTLANLAEIERKQQNFDVADSLARRALAIRIEELGEAHAETMKSLTSVALINWELGRGEEAATLYSRAAQVFDAARLRAGQGLARATFVASPYPQLAAVHLANGEMAKAWVAVEYSLGRVLSDLLFITESRQLSNAELAREVELRRELGQRERHLRDLRRSERSSNTLATNIAEADLLATQAEWSILQRELADRYPLDAGKPFELSRIQSSLAVNEAILGWLDAPLGEKEHSWAYLIRSQGPVRWARLVSDPTSEEQFRTSLAVAANWPIRVLEDERITRDAGELWLRRIAPIESELTDVERLFVIPSGPMLAIPLEALANERDQNLGDLFAVNYVPSATLFCWLRERQSEDSGRLSPILLVGDPDVGTANGNLLPLPGARREVARVRDSMEHWDLYTGAEASEAKLAELALSGELQNYATIHLATHALLDHKRPELSALLLAERGDSADLGAGRDGRLTAREILREWKLNANLVTLSACKTALGKAVSGEGHIGFAHALFQVGARSLLMSLWEVDDEATTLLMGRFYENLSGSYTRNRGFGRGRAMIKARALQEAKSWLKEYRDADGTRPYRHPAYWSAFILIGE